MTKDPLPLRQQALEMGIKLMDSEIRHLAASCDAARYGLEFGLRAVERRNTLIQYRDELQRMLNDQNNP